MTEDEYRHQWKETGPIKITMIEKHGKCKHGLGDSFQYTTPYERPNGVCFALLHVLDLYSWRVAQNFLLGKKTMIPFIESIARQN
jgi:hypothetical protein